LATEHPPTEFPAILFQDEDILVLHKPASWFVYPPDYKFKGRTPMLPTVTKWLLQKHDLRAFPAHRLDAATEGVMIFGLTKEATATINHQFKTRQVKKTYYAAIRGWMPEANGLIEKSLPIASTGEIADSITQYRTLSQIELPYKINSPHPTSRYAWLEVSPHTGRWHQIRRHFDMCAHPLVGDREHGDSHHNRFFRDQLGINGLCLFAAELRLVHPTSKKDLVLTGVKTERFKKLEELFLRTGPLVCS
tara:strand:- start:17 stop:763 length:747 start_codon:yes stop_codon:yes gene_type:complete